MPWRMSKARSCAEEYMEIRIYTNSDSFEFRNLSQYNEISDVKNKMKK